MRMNYVLIFRRLSLAVHHCEEGIGQWHRNHSTAIVRAFKVQ